MSEDITLAPGAATTARADQSNEVANTAHTIQQPDGKPPRVALVGRAGSGKTALAHALFGAQRQPTTAGSVTEYHDEMAPVIVDDLPGWVNGAESSVSSLVSSLESSSTSADRFAAIWYTLDASSARVTDYERQLIRRLAKIYPVVIALTRTDLISPDALTGMQSALDASAIPGCLGVVAVAADPLPALGLAPYGVAELVSMTPRAAPQTPPIRAAQPDAQPAPEPAPIGRQSAASQTTPGADYADVDEDDKDDGVGVDDQEAYATESSGASSSRALLAVLVMISLALALLLLGRRRRNDADDDDA